MKYAVNLIALMNLKEIDPIGALLFPPEILGEYVISDKKRLGTEAVTLNCDPNRAEAILTLVRQKYSKLKLPLYRSKTGNGGWKRI